MHQTFILTRRKTFRRGVRVFIKDVNSKMTPRLLKFSTEHLVAVKERKKRARQIAAEYTTDKPEEIEALFRDSAYGKDFTLKSDPEGKLKEATITVTPDDLELVALRGLFKSSKIKFDESKGLDLLREEYRVHNSTISGRKISGSPGMQIPHEPIDVAQTIKDTTNQAIQMYVDKYNEEVPEVINDLPHEKYLGFLSALADPSFDAKAFIENLEKDEEDIVKDGSLVTDTIEVLRDNYFKKFDKHVPIPKKNNNAWIKGKLEEKEK